MIDNVKILVVINREDNSIQECLKRLSSKIKGSVHLLYVKDIEPYPAEVLIELEKKYNEIKEKGTKVLRDLSNKIKELGFKVEVLGVHCGIAPERILKLEDELNPDIILLQYKPSALKRLFSRDYVDIVLSKSKAPILIAK